MILEFQRRRQATLRASAGWFAAFVALLAAGSFPGYTTEPGVVLSIILFAGAAFCVARLFLIRRNMLTCPNCDIVPADGENFFSDPMRCSFCGMKLK